MLKKIICKNCNNEINENDKKCFTCGSLNPNLNKNAIAGIISGILAIVFSGLALIGFLSALCGFTYANRIKGIEKYKTQYVIILLLTIVGLFLTLINWIFNNQ